MSNLKYTQRGFGNIEFQDMYGAECSIQKSSLATEDAIWFGINDADPKIMKSQATKHGLKYEGEMSGWMPFPISEDVLLSTRMHLSKQQVAAIIPILEAFLATGELPQKFKKIPKRRR